MRLETLHHRILDDARAIHAELQSVLPHTLPFARRDTWMNVGALIARLNHITKPFGILNTKSYSNDVLWHDVILSGDWSPKSERKHSGIDIQIHWELPIRQRRFILSEDYWNSLYFEYWWYILHELIHRHQDTLHGYANTRQFRPTTQDDKMRNEQVYLGDFSEVQAYAYNEALELMIKCRAHTWTEAKTHLPKRIEGASARVNFSYTTYVKTFVDTPTHPALRAFRRQTRRWFDLLIEQQEHYRRLGLLR